MLEPIYKTKFKKDLKLVTKRGKSIDKLKTVIRQLIEEKPLEPKYNDHPLKGNYVDTRECHIGRTRQDVLGLKIAELKLIKL